MMSSGRIRLICAGLALSVLAACASFACGEGAPSGTSGALKLTLGAYTTPREAYREIIPLFQAQWHERTGQTVTFEQSYLSSGAQSRAIIEGFEADIAALSLEADFERIARAGLITHDWRAKPYGGMVSNSIVVIGVRQGNPLNIRDWGDLARPGLNVLTPNPQTSGGAMWNILALYGAALRGRVTVNAGHSTVPANDEAAATEFLKAVLRNVSVMDKSARASLLNYEKGIGDVVITYENEILVGRRHGQTYEYVIPQSTLLIENPVAVVDVYADKHGAREAAEAFVAFLFTPEAQAIFARHGLRSPNPQAAAAAQFPPVADLFTIAFFNGWAEAMPKYFGEQGVYTRALAEVQQQR